MRIDEYGRTIVSTEEVFSMILQKELDDQLLAEDDEDTQFYNNQCITHDRAQFALPLPDDLGDPAEYHRVRASEWLVPQEYMKIDVRDYLYNLCDNEEQIARVIQEMDLYESKELTDILRLLIYLVDQFRANKVVWGVGRGSSVASYVLFLIGVNKIDSMKFGLEISDFLR